MLKQSRQLYSYIIKSALIVLSLVFILLIHGAIPFVSMPTLGQAIWTTGFSQSFVNQSILALYAVNFGNPEPAAISFGLAGAYPTSFFIRAGLHPADAYTLMVVMWLSVAFFGTWQIARAMKLSAILSAQSSILWLSMPIVWKHAGYSMLSLGIGLLPFYIWTSLRLFRCFDDSRNTSIRKVGFYSLATIVAVFMDGYSFMMFAAGSSIIGAYMFLRFPEHRRSILTFSLPVHIFCFAFVYILYISYIGKIQFASTPLDFFRGWGVDLMFLAVPSKGVHWLWDILDISLLRKGHEQFGDASVWITTFALPVVIVGSIAWWRIRKESKLATGFLIVGLFGFYMGMGPSLKLNSVKPEGVNISQMAKEYAVAPTGNAWLSKYVPGFKNMRAAYRWTALGFLGFWLLVLLLLSREQTTRLKWLVVFIVILLIVSNLPDVGKKLAINIEFRNDFFDMEKSLMKDMKEVLHKGEVVAFLPYRNDVFVNYLASRAELFAYNIGGDKNLFEARKHWPETMAQFKMNNIGEYFAPRVLLLLGRGEADAVLLPYIDLLWAAHAWPAPLKFKNEMEPIVTELRSSGFVDINEREFYAVIRLAKNGNVPTQLAQMEHRILQDNCIPPYCLVYQGTKRVSNQVGIHTGSGMQTDGRAGYLVFGPYQPMKAGKYTLQVTGEVKSNGDHAIVDVVYHSVGKTYARFRGLETQNVLTNSVLLEETVTLDEYVEALEVRVRVDKIVDLLIDGYSFIPINTEKRKDRE